METNYFWTKIKNLMAFLFDEITTFWLIFICLKFKLTFEVLNLHDANCIL